MSIAETGHQRPPPTVTGLTEPEGELVIQVCYEPACIAEALRWRVVGVGREGVEEVVLGCVWAGGPAPVPAGGSH